MNDTATDTAPEKIKPARSHNGYVIKVGDAAKLAHNDTLVLTVEFVDDRSGLASCVWFDANGIAQRFNFIARTLVVAR